MGRVESRRLRPQGAHQGVGRAARVHGPGDGGGAGGGACARRGARVGTHPPPPLPRAQTYTPHVVEPALGISRLVLAIMADGLREEPLPGGDARLVFHVAEDLAPVALAVLPLDRKAPLLGAADALLARVLPHARAELDAAGTIGKRYRRADEVGTPLCATLDARTLADGTVTLRDRDSMRQVRVHADEVVARAAARTLKPSAIAWPPAPPAAPRAE